ncbi:MAG: FAD:protein FMN transferase [Chitinophagaceae bacterium]|nr:FAD:protein FMN transferase [Chitinophagaceae bacterium]
MKLKISVLHSIVMLCVLLTSFSAKNNIQKIQLAGFAQGTTWHITYYAEDSTITKVQVDSILSRLDSSLSIYKNYSLISRFNRAKKGIMIDEYFTAVINKSIDVWKTSGGLFDITVMPLVQAWGFGTKDVQRYPDSAKIKSILKCIGSDKIAIRNNYLSKKKICITVDVNGIAQGYSVDVIAGFFEQHAIHNYLVEIGGEIRVKGRKLPENGKMKIGIEAPGDYDETTPSILQKIITLEDGAITTSGSYRKFHESNGKKFSHTISPKTGFPIQNELISVTVFASDAMTADAYDNVLLAMGLTRAIEFVEKRNDMSAYFIYKKADGTIADTASTKFRKLIGE